MGSVIVAAVWLASVWTTAPTQPVPIRPVYATVVKLRFTRLGLPIVAGHVNGMPVEFLLDTGATNTTFTSEAAQRLALVPTAVQTDAGVADGRRVTARYHSVPELAVGGCVIRRGLYQVSELAVLAELASDLGIRVDGILGGDMLRRLGAVVDYARAELRLVPDWAADLRQLQGTWVATELQLSDGPPRQSTRDNIHRVRLIVTGGRLRLDMTAAGSVVLDQRMELWTWHSPKQWVSSDVWVNGQPPRNVRVGEIGLYELSGDTLKLLMPSKTRPAGEGLPSTVSAAVPGSGMYRFTFRRLPPAPLGWLDLLLAAVGVPPVQRRPAYLGGWAVAVTPDWTLSGVNAARKTRLTARLDGSITVQPLRP